MTSSEAERNFEFAPTPAVAHSREHSRYVDCTLCGADHSHYLFHHVGVRFVRCRSCGLVYVNPVASFRANYFPIDGPGGPTSPRDRKLLLRDFEDFFDRLGTQYEKVVGRRPNRTLLIGRYMPELVDLEAARRIRLELAIADDAAFSELAFGSSIEFAHAALARGPEIVILNELLEACSDPSAVIRDVKQRAPENAWFVATYANAASLPAVLLRRHWAQIFDVKSVFFNQTNLAALMARFGLDLVSHFALPATRTLAHAMTRSGPTGAKLARVLPMTWLTAPFLVGNYASVFRAAAPQKTLEKLSIVMPVYNEAKYVERVIEKVLNKQLRIQRELVLVESNSTDGTREIVSRYANRPDVQVVLEERPEGKGHAVRTGLKAARGTIVLIQDADFEYDIDDYDALLEPILQRKAFFVLGSRSLGHDDWKVRRFAKGAATGMLINVAQVGFAATFNLLYQQRVTDVNTMFKVFRRECIDGLDLVCDGFDFDIELACKLVRAGYPPMEVPVNYVARSYAEGKKVSFVRDALPSYAAFFKYRFG